MKPQPPTYKSTTAPFVTPVDSEGNIAGGILGKGGWGGDSTHTDDGDRDTVDGRGRRQ